MAGIQSCRRLLFFNISRHINKNGIFLQPSRRRHHLVFRISSPQNKLVLEKSKLILHTGKYFTYRLSSTNVNEPKDLNITNSKKPEIESVQLNKDSASLSNEPVQLSNQPEIVGSSNADVVIDESLLPPPPIPDVTEVPVMEFVSMGLKEPSFQSLGLGSWWPSGIIQQIMEYLHIQLDLPWWQTILIMTIASRILLFPVNLQNRKDSIHMMNHMPEISKLQEKINSANLSGDFYSASVYANDLQNFIKSKKINMFSFLKVGLIQGPVFFSMFYALKGLANSPLESLKTEGLFWFKDLTQADPYYILPVILASTLFLVIEVGAEGNPARVNSHTVKWVMRLIPLVVFIFSFKFSACVTWYWTVSNLIVLSQVGLFKIPFIKRVLKLPDVVFHDTSKLIGKNKGFLEGFKEGIKNARIKAQLQERERMNSMSFEKAGSGAVPKTFKNNPLLQKAKKPL